MIILLFLQIACRICAWLGIWNDIARWWSWLRLLNWSLERCFLWVYLLRWALFLRLMVLISWLLSRISIITSSISWVLWLSFSLNNWIVAGRWGSTFSFTILWVASVKLISTALTMFEVIFWSRAYSIGLSHTSCGNNFRFGIFRGRGETISRRLLINFSFQWATSLTSILLVFAMIANGLTRLWSSFLCCDTPLLISSLAIVHILFESCGYFLLMLFSLNTLHPIVFLIICIISADQGLVILVLIVSQIFWTVRASRLLLMASVLRICIVTTRVVPIILLDKSLIDWARRRRLSGTTDLVPLVFLLPIARWRYILIVVPALITLNICIWGCWLLNFAGCEFFEIGDAGF